MTAFFVNVFSLNFTRMKHTLISLIFLSACTMAPNVQTESTTIPNNLDWQGHRGCRGLMPENSIEGFIYALSFPVRTLELDVVLTKDNVVLVSHEPWFSEEICDCAELENKNLYQLTYAEIKEIKCGNKPHPRFPEQQQLSTYKPSLIDVVEAVKKHCKAQGIEMPRFNIELKSQPDWDGIYLPGTQLFVERVYETIRGLGIVELTTIQSFDPRVLNVFMRMNTQLQFAFLTEEKGDPLEQMLVLEKLPDIYSPNHLNIDKAKVEQLQKLKMRVIPWTVNTIQEMREMLKMGVDGIITDYPNLILEL
jgi:glycerophosphoryl diester phosphodiesterase